MTSYVLGVRIGIGRDARYRYPRRSPTWGRTGTVKVAADAVLFLRQ
ncbi:hypothetical protein [Streptomyces sp. NBRC 110028]|nr:hypothetical protein [Streptomyces sp. NBRC 110028]